MGLKDLLLNRGWAGKTLSRQETVERLNPILRQHHELNQSYAILLRYLKEEETAAEETSGHFRELLKTARTDVGKLSETVLSAGGVSYSGTDLETEHFDLGSDPTDAPTDALRQVQAREQDLHDALSAELDGGDHQMRTRAILSVVRTNSSQRLDALDRALRAPRR